MSQSGSEVDTQLQNLLDVVGRNRDERCAELLQQAQQQARQIVTHAHRQARSQLHQQVLDTRQGIRQKLASAEAQSQTRLRLHRQHADSALLARAWEPLLEELQRRWQQAESRSLWIESLIRQASATLISTPWHVEHPADWSPTEQAKLKDHLCNTFGTEPVCIAEPRITAGLRICAGQACVDGTLEGLVRSRARIEGLLLAKLNDCRAQLAAAGHGND